MIALSASCPGSEGWPSLFSLRIFGNPLPKSCSTNAQRMAKSRGLLSIALLRWVRSEAANSGFRTQAELTQAYSLLVEVFLADMGATHARENEQLMAEGRLLGRQVVELVRTRMPVCSKDLAIGGRELLELIPQAEIKNILSYLLERVQSGNLPNEKEALLTAVHKHLKRKTTLSSGDNI